MWRTGARERVQCVEHLPCTLPTRTPSGPLTTTRSDPWAQSQACALSTTSYGSKSTRNAGNKHSRQSRNNCSEMESSVSPGLFSFSPSKSCCQSFTLNYSDYLVSFSERQVGMSWFGINIDEPPRGRWRPLGLRWALTGRSSLRSGSASGSHPPGLLLLC